MEEDYPRSTDLDRHLDEIPRALVPPEGPCLARRAAVGDDHVGHLRIRGLVAEHGACPVLAREVGADARVGVVEDLHARARRLALAERGEELLRLGRVGGLRVARMGGRVLAVEPGLDVREAAHDVAAAELEDGAAALRRMRLARVQEHLVDRRAREPPALQLVSPRGPPTRVWARNKPAIGALTGIGTPFAD